MGPEIVEIAVALEVKPGGEGVLDEGFAQRSRGEFPEHISSTPVSPSAPVWTFGKIAPVWADHTGDNRADAKSLAPKLQFLLKPRKMGVR